MTEANALHLSEPDIVIICRQKGYMMEYDQSFDDVREGAALALWSESEFVPPYSFSIRPEVVVLGSMAVDSVDPRGTLDRKYFVGTILRSVSAESYVSPGTSVFGFVLSDGTAGMYDGSPQDSTMSDLLHEAHQLQRWEEEDESASELAEDQED